MKPQYDVIVVGARCTGASLATLLARTGASVLLLDKDRLPSDQVISTHTVHPPGLEVLDELGVGNQVRQVATPMRVLRIGKNDACVDLSYADGRAEYCPRRERLDGLLQRAAVEAGAELMDHTVVTSLLEEAGRVAGVRVRREGAEHAFRARLVVGADGRRSTVASLVGAEEYLGYDAPRGMYWSYWEPPQGWPANPGYPFDFYQGNRHGSVRVLFQTDHGHLLLGSAPSVQECARWRANPRAALKADLASDPLIGPLIEDRDPLEPVRGTLHERYFFRQAAGPGWVLAGDAGHHKDFLIGDGITEALLQVRRLAAAIGHGTDGALRRWWRQRDVEALPLAFFASDEGRAGPPPQLLCVAFERIARDPVLKRRMALVMEHKLSPYEAIPALTALRWTLGAAARGQVGVLRDFLEMGRRASTVARELHARQKLLDLAAAEDAPAGAGPAPLTPPAASTPPA